MFYIREDSPASARIVAAEYFVNIDTGFGNCARYRSLPATVLILPQPGAKRYFPGKLHLFFRVKDSLDNWSAYEARPFIISNGTGIALPGSSDQTLLFQNYPNPFSGSTYIEYYLHLPGDVILCIYDALGKVVLKSGVKT
jgi:hypothetical protein